MNIVCVIPAKSNSSRVPNKNFRDFFDEKSLLQIKIEQCLSGDIFSNIYISSDSLEAEKIARDYGVNFIERDIKLCKDETPWSEVLTGVLKQVPVDDETYIAWSPLTSPLFQRYQDAVTILDENPEYDSVMTVTPMKHYFLNADKLPMNFQYGVWASYSQNIRAIYQMNCALWLAKKKSMIQNRFQIGDNPFYMETTVTEGVDIDTMEEFELAQMLYGKYYDNTAK